MLGGIVTSRRVNVPLSLTRLKFSETSIFDRFYHDSDQLVVLDESPTHEDPLQLSYVETVSKIYSFRCHQPKIRINELSLTNIQFPASSQFL